VRATDYAKPQQPEPEPEDKNELEHEEKQEGNIIVAFDSTDMKVTNRGE
jgi:hypothetical protein